MIIPVITPLLPMLQCETPNQSIIIRIIITIITIIIITLISSYL